MLVPAEILRGTTTALQLSRVEVAAGSSLSAITVRRAFERPAKATPKTLEAISVFLTKRGARFFNSNFSDGPGVELPIGLEDLQSRTLAGARAAAGISQEELAASASVSKNTLSRMERGRFASREAWEKVIRALAREGVEIFKEANVGSLGFRMRMDTIANRRLRF